LNNGHLENNPIRALIGLRPCFYLTNRFHVAVRLFSGKNKKVAHEAIAECVTDVRMPQLKMLENVLKPKETATVHARKHFSRGLGLNWDQNGQKRPFAA